MLTKKSFTRAAAASVAGLVVVLGSTGPAQADPGRSGGHGHSAHNGTRAAGSTGRADAAGHQRRAHHDPAASRGRQSGRSSSQGSTPRRHTPVTVCHLLGNGSYKVLTFDRHALRAHLAHGDLYPVPADGCAAPAAAAPDSAGGPADENSAGTTAGSVVPPAARPAVVAGVELDLAPATVTQARSETGAAVLGAEAVAAGRNASSPAPSATVGTQADSKVAGVLPQTGAAPVAGALLAGFGLLAAGAVLLHRRAPSTV